MNSSIPWNKNGFFYRNFHWGTSPLVYACNTFTVEECIIRKLNLIEFRFPIFLTLRAIEPTRLSNCTNFRLCICSIHSLLMAPVLFALRVLHGIQTWKIAQFVAIIRWRSYRWLKPYTPYHILLIYSYICIDTLALFSKCKP